MNPISFDTKLNRSGSNCSKWDAIPYDIQADDMIPMWVADMDFACPPAVIDAINERMEHPVFGYMQFPDHYWSSIINWHKSRYGADIEQGHIVPVSSVLTGVAMAVQGLTEKGDSILVPTPGYHAFYNAVINNGRKLVSCPLNKRQDRYELNFDLLEQQIISENVKMVLFCSPHNPTGRIWTREELAKLVSLCCQYHVYLVSDEIHSDMTLTHPFTTIFSAGSQAEEIAIALYAPTKTFNIAGLCTAYAVIKSQQISDRFNQAESLTRALAELGDKIDYAVNVDVPDENIINRMSGRRACLGCGQTYHVVYNAPKAEGVCDACGEGLVLRDDDKPETVKKRLDVYHEQTQPLIDYYKKAGVLAEVDGTQDLEMVFQDIVKILGA